MSLQDFLDNHPEVLGLDPDTQTALYEEWLESFWAMTEM